MFQQLTNLLGEFSHHYKIPLLDCMVYHKGEPVFRHIDGYGDYEKTKKADGTERYNLYSCSKPITCAATLQLIERGVMKLDDPLSLYIPEFKEMMVKEGDNVRKAEKPITLRNLFTMTAGLNYNLDSEAIQEAKKNTDGKCPTVETIRYLAQQPLDFEPGSDYQYSLCHDVLAAVVEVVSGMRFGAYVKKNIFDVLGMEHSTYYKGDFALSDIAPQYRFCHETGVFDQEGPENGFRLGEEYESGGAGCVSCVEDYIKFLEAMRKGDMILKQETITQMMTNQLEGMALEHFRGVNAVFLKYGYGLGVRCPREYKTVTDFGWDGAAGSYLAVDQARDLTIFYAQHVLNSPHWEARAKVVDYVIADLGL